MDSDPESWRGTLDKIEELDFTALVPGHGQVGDKSAVAQVRSYLDVMEDLVRQVISDGATVDDLLKHPVPAEFGSWSGGAYPYNLRFLFERLQAADLE